MVNLGLLTSSSIGHGQTFNWVWLIELLVSGIFVLFFLFYFNRLVATLVSYGLRAYSWHKFRVYIDIQALQISFLAGRIFFKGVRYHGENETIFIQNGYLTWTYWLRSARQVDLARCEALGKTSSDNESYKLDETLEDVSASGIADKEPGGVRKADTAQARIAVFVSGLEWFVYNRTPVYDAIVEVDTIRAENQKGTGSGADASNQPSGQESKLRRIFQDGVRASVDSTSGNYSAKMGASQTKDLPESSNDEQVGSMKHRETKSSLSPSQDASPTAFDTTHAFILRFLPVWIECQKGAISLGNEHTKALVVTTFDKAGGHVDAAASGQSDVFRQLFDFEIEHPVVQMRPNPDYRQTQMNAAERVLASTDFDRTKAKWWSVNWHFGRRRRKAWHHLRHLIPLFQGSVESFYGSDHDEKRDFQDGSWQTTEPENGHWMGLSRYLDDDEQDDHEGWTHVDYARFSTLLDSPSIHMNFYWDVPGKVSENDQGPDRSPSYPDINGSTPPAYGLELSVRGGAVNYGPWADRLRVEIQNAFLPNSYRSAQAAPPLPAGSLRQSTVMLIRVIIENEVTLRVPAKESSKDWQWRGRANALRRSAKAKKQRTKRHFRFRRNEKVTLGPDVRPFGWMSVSVAADSTVRYEMDMVARHDGFHNHLELDLKDITATSSVNHGLLWRSPSQQLSCDLSNPLGWNSLHTWTFNIHNQAMELFLVRDHMFLLIDLIDDFTAGPKADYMTFVPFQYHIGLTFVDLKLYLNANDSNIIDNPSDLEDNTFLILAFDDLKGTVDIPLAIYSPTQSSVLFTGVGHNAYLDLTLPTWNTLHAFVSHDPIATLKNLGLRGSYNYCSTVSPQLSDSLILDIHGGAPRVFLHGFLIRYFMNVKENYFGKDLHFRTLEEYQDLVSSQAVLDPEHINGPIKKENDLDVILTVKADKTCALMPGNIYSRKNNTRFDVLLVEADMRFTNYYMDLDVRSSPIEVSLEAIASEDAGTKTSRSNCQLFIDGVTVFGHHLFGAPPTEPSYVSSWDFDVGEIIGECSTTFLQTLILSIKSFVFTLDDDENALPVVHTTLIHDITILKAHVRSVRLWLLTGDVALLFDTAGIDVLFDDWAGPLFSEKVKATLPDVTLAAVDRKSASRQHDTVKPSVPTLAAVRISLDVQVLNRKAGFVRERTLQQQHVRFHDRRTHRADIFLHKQALDDVTAKHSDWANRRPTIPIPILPEPLRDPTTLSENRVLAAPAKLQHPERSFLSVSSHSASERRRTRTDRPKHRFTVDRSKSAGSTAGLVGGRRNGSVAASSALGAAVTFASPWIAPYFALQNVQPDFTDLPPVLQEPLEPSADHHKGQVEEDDTFPTESPKNAHTGLFFRLTKGLRAFCTPAFFSSLSHLVQDLEPTHPVDQLDAVQFKCISQITKSATQTIKPAQVTDISMRIPFAHMRIINRTTDEKARQRQDQYDVLISQTHVTARAPPPDVANNSEDSFIPVPGPSVHAVARQISIRVSGDAADGSEDRASAEGSIQDLGFWLGSGRSTRAKLQLHSIEFVTWGRKIEYLASLIQRTGAMTESVVHDFAGLSKNYLAQQLVYRLTVEAPKIADPAFLTRPSYVLRTAGNHLRLSDSWKILSRLRYVYISLPRTTQHKCIQEPFDRQVELPENAERQVLSGFDQWRNWDHDDEATPINNVLYGIPVTPLKQTISNGELEVDVSIRHTALVLDPGPNQSALTLGDINAGVSSSRAFSTEGKESDSPIEDGLIVRRVSVRSYTSRIALNIDWEIVELIGDTLEQFKLFETHITPTKHRPTLVPAAVDPSLELFLVLGTDTVSMMFETPNLGLKLASQKLRASVSHTVGSNHNQNLSVLLASMTASAKLRSKSRTLLSWRLSLPTVYASHISSATQEPDDLRVAATCHRLGFNLKENLLGVFEIARNIIDDEVVFVHKLISRIEKATRAEQQTRKAVEKDVTNTHIAMFLDDYRLKFAILPSFSYLIKGEVARTSIVPHSNGRLFVDLDLKYNNHFFLTRTREADQSTPALRVPPINARVAVLLAEQTTSVDVRTTFEKIDFEAAAVRACIDAVNRPDLARMIVDAKASVRRTKARVNEIFADLPGKKAQTSLEKSVPTVRYISHTTLAGVNIHCSAPGIKRKDYQAGLDFMLGFTTVCVHNRTDEAETVHNQPQFDIHMREIALGIRRTSPIENTNFGRIGLSIMATGATETDDEGNQVRVYRASSEAIRVDLYAETVSLVVDMAAFLQERVKSFTLNNEARSFRPLRRLTLATLEERPDSSILQKSAENNTASNLFFDAVCSLELRAIQVRWLLYDEDTLLRRRELEDLVFSIRKVDLKTKREGSARLTIADLQLQMAAKSSDPIARSSNSALMPEVVFNAAYVSTRHDRRLAFQAAGKALDLRLASDFILPASMLQKSLALASAELRDANEYWASRPLPNPKGAPKLLGNKRLASLLVDADFAGAVVNIKPREEESRSSAFGILKGNSRPRAGRYGQAMTGGTAGESTLRAPGIAVKVQYQDDGRKDPSLKAEFKVAASSNVLYPSVVPLVLEISSSIKEALGDSKPTGEASEKSQTRGYLSDTTISNSDPTAILGKCKLNAGLWIQKQEFSLSCQPIARVAATAKFDGIFMSINTVQTPEQDRFFALVTTFNNLHASVQHVYSRESTASFEVESIVMSMMNSKHVSSKPGISAIVNISPMKIEVNAKQVQDFLLFREIWYPPEIRQVPGEPTPPLPSADAHVQRYQQVAASGSFLWNAVVSVQELKVQVDLGQGLGKSTFTIAKLWASSKKNSDFEQNLCVGFQKVGVDSTGRMSGFVELQDFHMRSSIRWPQVEESIKRAPLVQGSVGFAQLRLKAAFDYQPFAVADISSFDFLMYNVRQSDSAKDRLVGILNGDKVQVFCTSVSAAQGLALIQAFERLVQEKQEAFHSSLRDLDKYLRRKSVFPSGTWTISTANVDEEDDEPTKVAFSLHTDVVVTLREVGIGVFPATFFDTQVLKAEATDAQARFAVATRNSETHSGLGMTLGQLRVALSNVNRGTTQALGEVSVPDVIHRATTSRGGTILRVPKVIAAMSTWQMADSTTIEYTFKSIFEGKVDVGWNYSRISFIRGMWNAHSKSLAQRLGKPLPESAVKIRAESRWEADEGHEKITAVVNVPQSKYEYVAREPPIIDTPQLYDLGEATPKLEMFGLHREKLPNVTHQIIIVTLLEVAKEVEEAYARILGSA